MDIDPIAEDINCPHCHIGRIGKVIIQDLKKTHNYLEGVIVITTFICLRCQHIVHREIRAITI